MSGTNSLSTINSSVQVSKSYGFFRRLLAFVGPAYLVSVGYMDPGNWATDIAGGSRFGYSLVWVLLMSNLMAILLQSLSARLGIVTGKDLAQASRDRYPKSVNMILWFLSEIAIIATDLAEVLGSAIGLQLLFHIPLAFGVLITAFDTILLLVLNNLGIRKMEAVVVGLISVIGLSFLVEIILSKPDFHGIAAGFIPSLPDSTALYFATGIIGATIMPHNLYLHSSLVQSRSIERTDKGIRQAIKFNIFDSVFALNLAFFVNLAILVMASAVFHKTGNYGVAEIQEAYRLLEPILGSTLAPLLFGIALIASGQSSTITGTLAGQIVMEGFINIRLQPWIRRLVTRLLAITPALIAIIYFGEESTGGLLVLSQVILSLQLSFAVIPLIRLVCDKLLMKKFAVSGWVKLISWIIALLIGGLNIKLVLDTLSGLFSNAGTGTALKLAVLTVSVFLGLVLIYLVFEPHIHSVTRRRRKRMVSRNIHGANPIPVIREIKPYRVIALALDFSNKDGNVLSHGASIARPDSTLVLMHVVESGGAKLLGSDIVDSETREDTERLEQYAEELRRVGISNVVTEIGHGSRISALTDLIRKHGADLVIFGSHGHKGLADIVFGTTADKVKHNIPIPVLIAR